MGKNVYSSEIKWAVIKDKMTGELTNKQIMEKYGIKNVSQIKNKKKKYRDNQIYIIKKKHHRNDIINQILFGGVFCMGKNVYSSEIKWAVIKDKMTGELTNKQIMEKYGIKNVSQIKTWMKWYRDNQIYRLDQ